MIGFDVTRVQAGTPAQRFWHHYRWKRAIVHGPECGCQGLDRASVTSRARPEADPGGTGFTRYLLGIRLMGRRETRGGGSHSSSRSERARRWRRLSLPRTTTTCGASWSKALQNAGYDGVISFDNGLSAYQRLREEPFELLLTDIVMPQMDGIELARRASEALSDIKIMFITGFAAVALILRNPRPRRRMPSPLQAGAPAPARQRSAEDARRLSRAGTAGGPCFGPRTSPYDGAPRPEGCGRVAQRKSTTLTW